MPQQLPPLKNKNSSTTNPTPPPKSNNPLNINQTLTNPPSVPVKQIKLTMPESMHLLLKQEQDKYFYKNIQELILEAVRDKYLRKTDSKSTATKKGRPKKIKPERILSKERIFSKKGKAIDI